MIYVKVEVSGRYSTVQQELSGRYCTVQQGVTVPLKGGGMEEQ
jgi:hypothetical protein